MSCGFSCPTWLGSHHLLPRLCHGPSPARPQDAGIAAGGCHQRSCGGTSLPPGTSSPSALWAEAMDAHVDLLTELQLLDKVPTLERLRAAQKRRAQQLKKWAQYEKEMQHKKRKHEKKRNAVNRKKVSFEASVALLEASLRNDVEEVCYLLKSNISPDLCNEDGLTALHQVRRGSSSHLPAAHSASLASGTGRPLRLLFFFSPCSGADLLAVNADGNMPYDLCEDEPTLDVIETCMAYQGITQERINEMRAAPEQVMICDIHDILATGQDLNRTDAQGATLLHIAAANGYLHAAEVLLDQGASLDVKDWDGWEPLHAAAFWGQMQMAELLVSHGASLSARTSLDEMPIDLCEEEEFKVLLLELKHKHDVIMKSQMRHKSSLSRRTSSTGSRGKVVRRASLSDRTNLYRKECEKEAMVWQQLGAAEEGRNSGLIGETGETRSDQENTDPNSVLDNSSLLPELANKSTQCDSEIPLQNGLMASASPYQYSFSNGDIWSMHADPESTPGHVLPYGTPGLPEAPQLWGTYKEHNHQTLSELKRQRAAAKLLQHPFLSTHFSAGMAGVAENVGEAKSHLIESRTSPYSSNGTSVYYTVSSGDPPLLKFKAPMEEMEEKVHGCCRIS
ncbi:protein phosphatase 1 regulatory inhibitor subunit 16B [Passer montanus]|uniref:protein phosphatase 1 regulatory inhibitor subunit 16B n=1 Tax=Passer montanus TaxID=9160 RepID=UPI001960080F|nr:protein phosphatase 1 regulatory inhibitor subunit 16B [Passer montanus]